MKKIFSFLANISLITSSIISISVSEASATPISFFPTLSTGDPINFKITLDDSIGNGKIRITIDNTSSEVGDISGVYFDITDSLLENLTFDEVSFMGNSNSPFEFISLIDQDGNANNLGNGVNMNGGSGQSIFDVGLKIGKSGGLTFRGTPDDYQKIVFDIGHSLSPVLLSDFENWGIRAKSVFVDDSRDGSSKLTGSVPINPVPEPLTILGVGTAIGFGIVFKAKLNKIKKNSKNI